MSKRKGLSYEEKMIIALNALPNPIEDKRHNVFIYFIDDKVRSNESRFEHVIDKRHELLPTDIKRIPKKVDQFIFKKDKERKETFNIYIRRNNYSDEYIKISLKIEDGDPHNAYVRTIYITKVIK